jgi:putative ABC transport system ATP-binding protein
MAPIIELKNVNKKYTQGRLYVEALKNINLSVERGEFITILGPSGSGKSTLLNVLGFLDKPSSGEVYYRGKRTDTLSKSEVSKLRQEIGFVFQRFNLIQRLTILENLQLSLILRDDKDKPKIDERSLQYLKLVGLSKRKDHTPKEISAGQQQRCAIARALIRSPKFLLLDEPTGNVDTKTRDQIIALIQKINKANGMTIILITHDLKIAEIANRTLYLVDGQLVDKEEFEKPMLLE